MEDLILCIYDELVAEGSQEYEMLQSVLNGGRVIELFGIEYAITHVEVQGYSSIEKYSRGAMNKTTIKAKRLIPVTIEPDIKIFAVKS